MERPTEAETATETAEEPPPVKAHDDPEPREEPEAEGRGKAAAGKKGRKRASKKKRAADEAPEGEEAPAAQAEPDAEEASAPAADAPETDVEAPQAEASGADAEAPQADADSDGEPADDGRVGPGDKLTDEELLRELSALVFASPEPLSTRKLVDLLRKPRRERLQASLETLGERLTASGLGLMLTKIAGGWQILTAADTAEAVARMFDSRRVERLSPAALETLAVVAYRQPVTKAEIEAIRGVQAGPVLRSLVDRGLLKVVGRAEVPGHPLQYGTTREFLDRFGLDRLKDLPRDGELARD